MESENKENEQEMPSITFINVNKSDVIIFDDRMPMIEIADIMQPKVRLVDIMQPIVKLENCTWLSEI